MNPVIVALLRRSAEQIPMPLDLDIEASPLPDLVTAMVELRDSLATHPCALARGVGAWLRVYQKHAPGKLAERLA
jgi:hypothetical protein